MALHTAAINLGTLGSPIRYSPRDLTLSTGKTNLTELWWNSENWDSETCRLTRADTSSMMEWRQYCEHQHLCCHWHRVPGPRAGSGPWRWTSWAGRWTRLCRGTPGPRSAHVTSSCTHVVVILTRGPCPAHLLCLPVQPAGAVVCWGPWPGKVTVGARWPGLGAALPSCNTAALDQLRPQSQTIFRGEEINIFIAKYFIELRIFPFQLSRHTQWHRLPRVVTLQSLHAAPPLPLPPSSDLVRGRLLPPAAAPGLAGLRHGELQPVLWPRAVAPRGTGVGHRWLVVH